MTRRHFAFATYILPQKLNDVNASWKEIPIRTNIRKNYGE